MWTIPVLVATLFYKQYATWLTLVNQLVKIRLSTYDSTPKIGAKYALIGYEPISAVSACRRSYYNKIKIKMNKLKLIYSLTSAGQLHHFIENGESFHTDPIVFSK